MADLPGAIETLAEALDIAADFVPPGALEPVAEIERAARKRHGFLGDTVVVALAGGTGSGKSSLLNALADHPVSPVGPVRPTTARPLGWIPANPEPGLVRLLDDLGIDDRAGHDSDLPVAIIDLPDFDSVEFEHRATVETLLPRVDAVIWVLDPQKYSDRALHRDYLVPLAAYQQQFLFVLNQTDRLDDSGLRAVVDDLQARLTSEGFDDPHILTTAARPATGPPRGIETLTAVIGERFRAKQTAHAKLVEDVRRAHYLLAEAAGLADRPDLQLTEVWQAARDTAVDGLADLVAGPEVARRAQGVGERAATSRAAGPVGRLGAIARRSRFGRALGASPDDVTAADWWAQPGLERVLAGLSRTVTDISTRLGGGLGRRVRAELAPERLEAGVRGAVEGARGRVGDLGPPAPRWWWGAVGAVQLVLFVAMVAGAVWLWVDGVDTNEIPWHLIVIGASVLVAGVLSWGARTSGARAGRRSADAYRATLHGAIEAEIEGRIGAVLTSVVSVRDRLAATLRDLEARLD